MSHRLEAPAGARIDRTRPLSFTFNGRTFGGFSGDTLASALLANDVRLLGRSFKPVSYTHLTLPTILLV